MTVRHGAVAAGLLALACFHTKHVAKPGVEEIRRRVRKRLRPGAIVLLHDGDGYDPEGDRLQTAHALPGIIEDGRHAGYEFAPLSELLNNHS